MHEFMHFVVDAYFWQYPLGILFFALFGGILGFAFAKQRHVWRLSALVSALTISLIPWSFMVEHGHSLAPIAYFPIALTVLCGYWLTLVCTRLIR